MHCSLSQGQHARFPSGASHIDTLCIACVNSGLPEGKQALSTERTWSRHGEPLGAGTGVWDSGLHIARCQRRAKVMSKPSQAPAGCVNKTMGTLKPLEDCCLSNQGSRLFLVGQG